MDCQKLRLVAEESLPSLEAPNFAKRFRKTVPDSLGDDGGDVDRLDPGVAPDEAEILDGFVCEGVELESDASSCDSSDLASEDDFEPLLEEFLRAQKGRHPFGDADRKELEALEAREGTRGSSKRLAGEVMREQPEVTCSTEPHPPAPHGPSLEVGGGRVLFTCDMLQKEVVIVNGDAEAPERRKFVTMSCDDDADDYEALLASSCSWYGVVAGDAVMLLRNSEGGRPGDAQWWMAHGVVKGLVENVRSRGGASRTAILRGLRSRWCQFR